MNRPLLYFILSFIGFSYTLQAKASLGPVLHTKLVNAPAGVAVMPATVPAVTVGTPSSIGNTSATLNATVNDDNANTTVTILYGTDPGLAGAASAVVSPSSITAGSGNTAVSAGLTGLSLATVYYYQVSATNSAGTTTSTIYSFNTTAVITNVDVPPNGTYLVGNQLVFTVHFYPTTTSLLVNTTGGTPYIPVTVGTGTEKAVFGSVDATYPNVAYFVYTVASGDYAPAGITLGSSVVLNGGTITDAAGTNTGLTVSGVSSTTGVLVDAAPPVVISSNLQNPLTAAVNAGTSVTYQVTFSKAVTGVDVTDFTLTGTGTAAGSILSVTAVSGSVYNVTVGPLAGNGTMRLDVNNSGTGIADVMAGLPLSGGFISGQTYTISTPAITVTPTSPAAATVGASYTSTTFSASGGTAPYTYAVTSGSLPAGITLNASTGALTGTPTAGGAFPATVTATDANSITGSVSFTLTVNAATIVLSPATLSDGIYGTAFTTTLAASGGTLPYTYAVTSGSLPPGLTLNSGTGVLSGAPTAAGPYNFTVTATDASTGTGPYAGSQAYSLVIDKAALTITADNQSSTYGQALPALTVTYSGFVNGDTQASLTTAATASTTATAASPAGSYTITPSGAVDNNYAITYVNGTLTIGQAALTITADNQSSTYGQALPALTVTYSGFVNGDTQASLTTAATASTTATAASPAGSYTITPSGAVDNNYTIVYVAGTLTIGQAALTITADNQSSTYGGAIPALTVTYSGFVNGDTQASLTTAATASTTATAASPAGSYTITPSGAVDNNYAITYVNGTLTIGQAALTITADNQSSTYGGAIPALTVTYSGFVNGDTQASLTTAPTASTTATAASPAGSYTITPSGAVDNNYAITYVNGTLTIGQAALTITADNQSSTYGGAIPALTVTYSGFVNGDTQASLTTAATASTTATAASPAGSYTITPSGAVDNNYAITYVNGTLTIGQAALSITADNQNSTYGQALPALTVTYSGFVNGDTQASLTTAATASTTATAASPAGSYTITPSGAVDNNYAITYVNGTLTIGQAALTITADNQSSTYGGAIPALTVTYSGFVNGDTQASLTTAATASTTATAASPAGSYTITPSGAVDNNYAITYVNGTLTIGQAALTITADNQSSAYGGAIPTLTVSYSGFVNGDNAASLTTAPTITTTGTSASPAGAYPITANGAVDNNYAITYVGGTLTIGKLVLTITADNQSSTYGGAIPALTVTYSGFVNGDTQASLTTEATVTTTATSASPVGAYPINASGAVDNNYTIVYVAGTLTIGQAALTITADNQSSTYGSAIPALTVTYSGFVNGDTQASLTTAATASTTAAAASPAGSYTIIPSGVVDNNYAITYVNGTLTIGQAALTITADNQSSTYGQALPALTATYSGFVNGDNAASLATAPTITTTGTASSAVGTYPITASGAVANNYTITYVAGTLTIGKAALTITADNQSSTYGQALPALMATYSGFVNGDNAASLATAPTITTTGTASSPVGTYPITASGAVDNNYAITYVAGTLTIGQAALTITADNQSSTYGGAIPTLTATYSGFVNGDNAASLTTAATVTTTATSASPVGAYPITASGAVDNNYAITYVAGTLTIGQAALTITADNQSSTYGGAIPTLTASYSGFVNGDNAASLTTAPTITTTGTSASPVGTYPVTASGAVDNNYTITYVGGTLTIGKAALTITANNQSKTYGQANPALTASYSGFVNGDNTTALTTQPVLSTTATIASGVGAYPINVGGAADANYDIVYVNGSLTVTPATLLITATSQSRYYNQPNPVLTYTYSGFVNGDDASVLTALPSITTSAVQSSPAGQYPITLSGGTAANYTFLYQDGVLTVLQSLANTITFGPLPVKTYGDPDFVITATANSGLPVRFVSGDNSIATVTQNAAGDWVVHIVSAGQVTISAFQDGDAAYAPAAEVDQSLQINKKDQSITFAALPATATTTDAPLALMASASSGLPITFTVSDPTLAAISGGKVTFTGTGMVTITATQPGNDDYNAAAPVSYTVEVFNGAAYQSHIGVFPNPAHGTLYIRFSQDYLITKYILFGINGQIVKGMNTVTASTNVLPVDVSDLAPGYYLLRVVCIRSGSISFPVFKVLIQ